MFASIARAVFGSANDRSLKGYQRRVPQINAHEPAMAALSDAALRAKTAEFRERLAGGATLDDLLPEAYAAVREAAKRVLGQRHFDVQLIGGMVLHDGKIAEMKTGEGKTLVATLPVYLNALAGRGVHVVTVNDYLAKRDSEWMGRVYGFLGLSTGVIVHGLTDDERRAAYAADITYGTNNEFGFDYLRDNMKYRLDDMAQRDFAYAIVDEVDSILIDEARTPLIISGPAEDSSDLYRTVNLVVRELVKDTSTFEKDEKFKTVTMTEEGSERVEQMLRDAGIITEGNLYDIFNVSVIHHVQQSLRANTLFARDVDYIVRDDKVVLIDEFTGRMMEGPSLLRGPASGAGGQGGRDRPAGEPDARQHHLPELLPPVSEACRHDRHGDDGSRRVRRDLQARSARNPDQRAGEPQGRRRRGVPFGGGEVRGGRHADRGGEGPRPAGAGRHHQHREERGHQRASEPQEGAARRAERALPRAGSHHRRPGRGARRHHHRHQHGRAWHRHQARWQRRDAHDAWRRATPIRTTPPCN